MRKTGAENVPFFDLILVVDIKSWSQARKGWRLFMHAILWYIFWSIKSIYTTKCINSWFWIMKPSKLDDILLILFVLNSFRESGYDVRSKVGNEIKQRIFFDQLFISNMLGKHFLA